MKPNDILEWNCPKFGFKRQWRVLGCHLGGTGQESIIELENVTETAGRVEHISPFPLPSLFVPEALLRDLQIIL